MILSDIGNIVVAEWEKSFELRAELFCDAFVIMPNHIHAILRIEKPIEIDGDDARRRDARPCVSTTTTTAADNQLTPGGVAYRAPKSISSFVVGFKSAATQRINAFRDRPGFPVWQPRFHDHIIRDEKSYDRIW